MSSSVSLVNSRHRSGPNTLPCGIPLVTYVTNLSVHHSPLPSKTFVSEMSVSMSAHSFFSLLRLVLQLRHRVLFLLLLLLLLLLFLLLILLILVFLLILLILVLALLLLLILLLIMFRFLLPVNLSWSFFFSFYFFSFVSPSSVFCSFLFFLFCSFLISLSFLFSFFFLLCTASATRASIVDRHRCSSKSADQRVQVRVWIVDYNKADWEGIRDELGREKSLESFTTILESACKGIPTRKITRRRSVWMNRKASKATRKKTKTWKKYRQAMQKTTNIIGRQSTRQQRQR